ncbi:MAG TPA: hypothetical protein VL572_01215 [Pyrinomonadaceae bacterium]|nr:hypothetical protein [Pyrinomonadaceae bacterium]
MIRRSLKTFGLLLVWAFLVIAVILVEANWFAMPRVVLGDINSIENHLVGKLSDAARDRRNRQ